LRPSPGFSSFFESKSLNRKNEDNKVTQFSLAKASAEIGALNGADLTFSESTRRMMVVLKQLVPCDTINLGTVDLDTEEGFHFALNGFLMPAERRALLPRFKHQHPMLNLARRGGITPPLRFSDFSTRREFEESAIYRECYRGFTHSMLTFGVAALPGLNVSFVLSRSDQEFAESDCENMAILQPLISAVLQQRILRDAFTQTKTHGQQVGIVYGSGPYIHMADAHAMNLLRLHYPDQSRHSLPNELWSLLASQFTRTMTAKDFPGGGRLCAHIGPNASGWQLELWEDSSSIPLQRLHPYALTPRQTEVLQWLAHGKGNHEIALILGISPRTVEKHLEGIYRQIGVENRIAALHFCQRLRDSI
jgi:DNA-binding CsgD family transcriptional regulator